MTKADAGDGLIVVTISRIVEERVRDDLEIVVYFKEAGVKPWILKSTNAKTIAKITGSGDSDEWSGHRIELYHDPDVEFGGEKTGGIRVRAPAVPAAAPPAPAADANFDDDIQF